MQIPEEHDLESQILKEREWRFLRNARVRRQARRLIQKGEGRGGAAPNTKHARSAPGALFRSHSTNPFAKFVSRHQTAPSLPG